ncbi:hypothetical protein BJ138DRAFT_980463, partial [Hygrophoropsis aurantiaca]
PRLSEQLRQRIVVWRYDERLSISRIATLAGCSERTVHNILRLEFEYGQVTNPLTRPRGRPRALQQEDLNFITSILDANPTLYTDEIQEQLLDSRGVD